MKRLINLALVLALSCICLFVLSVLFPPSSEQKARWTQEAAQRQQSRSTEAPNNEPTDPQVFEDQQSRDYTKSPNIPHHENTSIPSVDPNIVATQRWFTDQQTQAVLGGAPMIPAYSTSTPVVNVQNITVRTLYVQGSLNVRDCPRTDCNKINYLTDGQAVQATGTADGEAVRSGNTTWYRISLEGRVGYIYSEFVTDRPPTTIPTSRPVYSPVPPVVPQVQPQYACNGVDDLNCDDFPSDGRSAQQHLETCGIETDEDRLDRDNDGLACEFRGW